MHHYVFTNKKPNSDREYSRVDCRANRIKSAHKTCEQRGINTIGSSGEPMGKRAAVQGWQFALEHACAANTYQGGELGIVCLNPIDP